MDAKKNYSEYPMIQELKPFLNAKEIISFFIIAAVPPLFFCMPLVFSTISSSSCSYGNMILGIIFVSLYAAAAGHAFLLGLPAYLLGKRLNAIRWWTCVLVALLIGGIPITILNGWGEFIPAGLFGASAGFAFWLLWRFWICSDQPAMP